MKQHEAFLTLINFISSERNIKIKIKETDGIFQELDMHYGKDKIKQGRQKGGLYKYLN